MYSFECRLWTPVLWSSLWWLTNLELLLLWHWPAWWEGLSKLWNTPFLFTLQVLTANCEYLVVCLCLEFKRQKWRESLKISGSGVLCVECDKRPPPADSTPFNGCPASSALFPICIVPSIVFLLFPRLYFYSFLLVLFPPWTKGIDSILLHKQKSKFGAIDWHNGTSSSLSSSPPTPSSSSAWSSWGREK